MAVFRFRLATLLRLREAVRDEKRGELAVALRADAALEERINQIGAELAEILAGAVQSASPGAINVDRLLEAQRYELVLRAEQKITAKQRELLDKEIEKRREALVAADREMRVIEKVREVQLARHQEDAERREVATLDEVALRRYTSEEAV